MNGIEPNLKTLFDEFAVANFRGHVTHAAALFKQIRSIWLSRLTPEPEVPDIICMGGWEQRPTVRHHSFACRGTLYQLQSDINGTRRYVRAENFDPDAYRVQRLTQEQRLDRQFNDENRISGFVSIMERYGGEGAYHEYLNGEPDYALEQQLDVLTAALE